MERWREISPEKGYEVSDAGRVRSVDRVVEDEVCGTRRKRRFKGRILKQSLDGHGYPKVKLGGRGRQACVHRLVLEAFSGMRPEGCEARHLDGDRLNNALENLAWGTAQENANDRVLHGTTTKGEGNPSAKLTKPQVREILSATGSQSQIAEAYGVSRSCIQLIRAGKNWQGIASA